LFSNAQGYGGNHCVHGNSQIPMFISSRNSIAIYNGVELIVIRQTVYSKKTIFQVNRVDIEHECGRKNRHRFMASILVLLTQSLPLCASATVNLFYSVTPQSLIGLTNIIRTYIAASSVFYSYKCNYIITVICLKATRTVNTTEHTTT